MKKYRWFNLIAIAALMLVSFAAPSSPANAQAIDGTSPPPVLGEPPPWASRGAKHITNAPQTRIPDGKSMTSEMLLKHLPYMSSGATRILTDKFGVETLAGKKLNYSKMTDMDNIVNASAFTMENEPSVAVNPTNEAIVVAFHHYYPTSDNCLAQVSFDGGDTFDYRDYVVLPLQAGGNTCADPVVNFSPDGGVAYYFYMDIAGATSDILIQRASGYDPTALLGPPVVVFDDYGDLLDKPWGDVAYDTSGASDPVVYVTSTFFSGSDCGILFNVSYNYGTNWVYGDTGLQMTYSGGCNPVKQGSRPIGNPFSGWVSICWYDSENDGWQYGKFDIDCWSNDSYGSGGSWYLFTPVNDQKNELWQWLGPNEKYHRWWGGMYPSLAVDDTGLLYIAYTRDPTANHYDKEAGDVMLARGWPTGAYWSKQAVDDASTAATAQGYPTVTARCDYQKNKCFSYVAYFNHKSGNKLYDIVYRKFTRPFRYDIPGKSAKGGRKKISDVSSFSDYSFLGDYIDSFVTSRRYHVVWTDRSDVWGINDPDDDVMHDALKP